MYSRLFILQDPDPFDMHLFGLHIPSPDLHLFGLQPSGFDGSTTFWPRESGAVRSSAPFWSPGSGLVSVFYCPPSSGSVGSASFRPKNGFLTLWNICINFAVHSKVFCYLPTKRKDILPREIIYVKFQRWITETFVFTAFSGTGCGLLLLTRMPRVLLSGTVHRIFPGRGGGWRHLYCFMSVAIEIFLRSFCDNIIWSFYFIRSLINIWCFDNLYVCVVGDRTVSCWPRGTLLVFSPSDTLNPRYGTKMIQIFFLVFQVHSLHHKAKLITVFCFITSSLLFHWINK